ncbi:MAG: protein-L-isoaspartate O-methyltransferase [Pseudomonadota bacterium]|nr:protein-L-isoaspartate O-methyltransferase [Pseudomonadota bacterium]
MNFEEARSNMVEQQIRPWEVLDQRVLNVLAATPREDFVPPRYRRLAFADVAIPLGHGQVMMTPAVEGRLLQSLALQPTDAVLEVGTGSGYLCACLARLAGGVTSVDIVPEFTEAAAGRLDGHGIDNARLRTLDAARGWVDAARFDAIAITGSVPVLPDAWRQALAIGGRLFAIVGEEPVMEAVLITRTGPNHWFQESLFDTVVPPLINAERPARFQF